MKLLSALLKKRRKDKVKFRNGKLELEEVVVAVLVILVIVLGIIFLNQFKEKMLFGIEKLKEIFGR